MTLLLSRTRSILDPGRLNWLWESTYTNGPFVNVKSAPYRAKGDGSTDDTAAFQDAVDAIGTAGGGILIIPPGTFLVSDSIALCSKITVISAGGAVVKLADNAVSSLSLEGIFHAVTQTDITISGLTINGNKANNDVDGSNGQAIEFNDCSRVRVLNNYIYDMPRNGITFQNGGSGCFDVIVNGNTVLNSGCTSTTQGGEGILAIFGSHFVVAENICRGGKLRGIQLETLGNTLTDWVISNNVCEGSAYGIGINGPTDGTISGNRCESNTSYGIRINDSATTNGKLVVTGNTIKNSSGTAGISLEKYTDVVLSGNYIEGYNNNISMQNFSRIVVTGNELTGALNDGLEFNTGTNADLVVSGNIINAANQSSSTYNNVKGTCTTVSFTGNRVKGTSAVYGIVTAGSGWTIENNTLDNSGSTAEISDGATSSRIRNNGGWKTENAGSGTITSGTTSATITHSLSVTPNARDILITPTANTTNDPGNMWVDTIGSTTFKVNCRSDPGASNLAFGWSVKVT